MSRVCRCGGPKSYGARVCYACYRAPCGTDGGYYRHVRGGVGRKPEPACRPCLDAHADAQRRPGAEPRRPKPKPFNEDNPRWTPVKGIQRAS